MCCTLQRDQLTLAPNRVDSRTNTHDTERIKHSGVHTRTTQAARVGTHQGRQADHCHRSERRTRTDCKRSHRHEDHAERHGGRHQVRTVHHANGSSRTDQKEKIILTN